MDCLDAASLGLETDSELCHALSAEIGSPPPWPLSALQAVFDNRYPGWDEPSLAVSSPISRLQNLSEAFHSKDREVAAEALLELPREVKHAQIRVMCPRTDGSSLTDECSFLLTALDALGALALAEREARLKAAAEAARRLEEVEASRRSAHQDELAAAKFDSTFRLEEMASELDIQQRRADKLEREMKVLAEQAALASELQLRCNSLDQDLRIMQHRLTTAQDDLREAKSQKAAIALAHEDSDAFLQDLQRRLEHAQGNQSGSESHQATARGTGYEAQVRESFVHGAKAAMTLQNSADDSLVRSSLLAWKMAVLQAKHSLFTEKVAAKSLEADLFLVGCHKAGPSRCCCSGPPGSCCRAPWLEASLKALEADRHSKAKPSLSKARLLCWGRRALPVLLSSIPFLAWKMMLDSEPFLCTGC